MDATTSDTAQEKPEDGQSGFAPLDANELNDLVAPGSVDAPSPPETASDPAPPADPNPADATRPAEAAAPSPTAPDTGRPAPGRAVFARLRALAAWRPTIARAGAAVLALCIGSVWLYYRQPAEFAPAAPATAPTPFAAPVRTPSEPAPVAAESGQTEWATVFREVDAFRARLSAQREEILRLRQHYDYGVRELEEEAVFRIKEAGAGSAAAALKQKPIELLLTGIQRRQTYRDALEQPLNRLALGSEELLFLERRARIDLLVSEAAVGIDMAEHCRAIAAAMAAHEPTPEALRIPDLPVPAAEAVWRRLAEEARQKTFSAEERLSYEITAEVCSGHLGRAAELTTLPLKCAACLAESGSRELFLNSLTQLTPLAAGKLAEWPGRWLALNGLKRLPVEAARALFAWPGDILSLNGLAELSPEAAQYLTFWRGRQLELAGLRKGNALEALADWEALGGRLFVAGDIRRQLDMIRQSSAGTGMVMPERRGKR